MTSTNSKKLETIKHQAKSNFEKSNPKIWGEFVGDADAIAKARNVEERALVIRKNLAAHCKKHRANWVSREAVKVYEERQQRNKYPAPRPSWASPHQNIQPIMEEARNRVQQRIQNRIKRVGEIERSMKVKIAQTMDSRRQRQSLSQAKKPSLQQDFSQSVG